LLLLLSLIAPASAGPCAEDYTSDNFLEHLTAAQTSLRGNDDYAFINNVSGLQGGLDCLSEALPPRVLASAYRLIGAQIVLEGSTADGQKWFRTALELDPTFQWDITEFSQEGTDALVRDAWNAERGVSHAQDYVSGKALAIGPDQRLYLDGVAIDEPAASPNRYHLLQLMDSDGVIKSVWVIDGLAFPERVLGVPEEAAVAAVDPVEEDKPKRERTAKPEKEPREKKDRGSKNDDFSGAGVISVERNRPPLQLPLLITGGLAVAAGGGLYALSFGAANEFEAATTEDNLTAARKQTNTYVGVGAGLVAVGAGLGTWGMLLEGTPTVGFTWTW